MRVIHLARKPLSEPSVAQNVLEHGTGALNIDASRVGDAARWPANLIFEHLPGCQGSATCDATCPVAALDSQSGILSTHAGVNRLGQENGSHYSGTTLTVATAFIRDTTPGGASKFFKQVGGGDK